jgi:hypothetical protein
VVCAAAVSTLPGPVFPIALTLLYYDQRIRKDGFDIEWMLQSAGLMQSAELVQSVGLHVPEFAAPANATEDPETSVPLEELDA